MIAPSSGNGYKNAMIKKADDAQAKLVSLMDFLAQSPTPFHAVLRMMEALEEAGFEALRESEAWALQKNRKYYVMRNDSSLIAFKTGEEDPVGAGWRMVGAHTDSPCLKLKPNPTRKSKNYLQAGIEVYGGAILHTWFDRDLSLAGRIGYLNSKGKLDSLLLDFKRPIAVIPSLAIHLNRTCNENFPVNAQKDLPPLLLQSEDKDASVEEMLLGEIQAQKLARDAKKILSHELSFYDTQAAARVGAEGQFLASARLDNLLSCWIGLQALIDSRNEAPCLLVCNDHEEVGSVSASGAEGPFLKSVLQRLAPDPEDFARMMHASILVSCDNAHGVHPNYADKHDEQHGPLLNAGPVIKINANQRYATNSETAALFASICEGGKIPYQKFAVRADMGCGSTLGPLTAANLGVKTVDIGLPTFAMHSIRELAGVADIACLSKALQSFYTAL